MTRRRPSGEGSTERTAHLKVASTRLVTTSHTKEIPYERVPQSKNRPRQTSNNQMSTRIWVKYMLRIPRRENSLLGVVGVLSINRDEKFCIRRIKKYS